MVKPISKVISPSTVATALRTLIASLVTSIPIPSPGNTAILYLRVVFLLNLYFLTPILEMNYL
ncbi:hypothetical protein JCM17380_27040 [Desulfosporosinus burensis]